MKRTLAAVGVPAIAALVLLGGAPAASAGEHHGRHHDGHHDARSAVPPPRAAERAKRHNHQAPPHPRHHCTTGKRCRPAPLPKPTGGWPCAKTHSCASHHHYPICKPKHHHKPTHPGKPSSHVGGHKKPHGHHLHGAPQSVPEQLAFTGANTTAAIALGVGLIGLGGVSYVGGRKPRKQTKAIRAALPQ